MPRSTGDGSGPYRTFDEKEITEIFSYHLPTQEQAQIYQKVNDTFVEAVNLIAPLLPDGPGKNAAIRKLADARMACNAAVALDGKF